MDFERIIESCEGFDWDKGNWDKNWQQHRVAAYEAEQLFFNVPFILQIDGSRADKDPRFYALGQTDEARWLFVAFSVRSKKIRVISARDMTARERKEYQSS